MQKMNSNIKKDLRNVFSVWKQVFSNWKYLIIAVAAIFIFYFVNVVIASYNLIIPSYNQFGFFGAMKFFLTLFMGFKERLLPSSFISLIVIAVLFGILVSLMLYRTEIIKKTSGKNMGFFGTTGVFLGILAPGCPACGIGILGVLGIGTSFLALLPFKGLEISVLAILILSFATFKITKSISKETCKI